MSPRFRLTWLVVLTLVLGAAMGNAANAADTIVVLVRHAEKATDDPKDPGLSARGTARAEALAGVLANADLAAVFSTQFQRTRQTGMPAATRRGLTVQVRDANQANAKTYTADLIKEIQTAHAGSTVLVVGHSNTIPEMIKALTGIDVPAIREDEFNRLYIVSLGDKPRLLATAYGD